MRKIFKYPLAITDVQTINMPRDARLLSVGLDGAGTLCLWAEVNPAAHSGVATTIRIYGTGHPIDDELEGRLGFLGTVLHGCLVWHVFVEAT